MSKNNSHCKVKAHNIPLAVDPYIKWNVLSFALEACTGAGTAGAPRGRGRSLRGPRGVGLRMTGDPAGAGLGHVAKSRTQAALIQAASCCV